MSQFAIFPLSKFSIAIRTNAAERLRSEGVFRFIEVTSRFTPPLQTLSAISQLSLEPYERNQSMKRSRLKSNAIVLTFST